MLLALVACLAIFLMILPVVWGHSIQSDHGSILGLILGFIVFVLLVGGMLIYASVQ